MDPYDALLVLARTEAELIADGRWEEAAELGRRREELVATLPDTPPPHAADALREASRLVRSSTGAASVAVAETRAVLQRLNDGRRAVAGYARSG